MAIDTNDPRPADTDNKLLQKILNRLKSGIGIGAGAVDIGTVDQGNPGAAPWPVKSADGDLNTIGARADATANAATLDATPTTSASLIAINKAILDVLYRSSVDTTPL